MSNLNIVKKILQQLSADDLLQIVAEIEATRLDPNNPSQAVMTKTIFMKESNVSKYRPKKLVVLGESTGSYINKVLESNTSTSYTLLKELQSNRDHFSNISHVDIAGKDTKNFSTNISVWLKEDLIVAIKTKQQITDIGLASMAAGIPIDMGFQKGRRYFMFNPELLLPYSRTDKGKHFDLVYLIYQYLKSYVSPTKSAYQTCFKLHKDSLVREYFKDTNQCSFDEFLVRSKEYVNQCLKGNEPTIEGWFKLTGEQLVK